MSNLVFSLEKDIARLDIVILWTSLYGLVYTLFRLQKIGLIPDYLDISSSCISLLPA